MGAFIFLIGNKSHLSQVQTLRTRLNHDATALRITECLPFSARFRIDQFGCHL